MSFPLINRQLEPGLRQVLSELEESLLRTPTGWRDTELVSSRASITSTTSSTSYAGSSASNNPLLTNGMASSKSVSEEFLLRKAFEGAISAATELFQRLDQTQMDTLSNSTNLTGAEIDRMIERYLAEQVHDHILWPRTRAAKDADDRILHQRIIKMRNVDMIQVGIPCVDRRSRMSMVARLKRGIAEFEKLPQAKSPQAAIGIILKTAQTLTQSEKVSPSDDPVQDEKASAMTINADMLVSMLLLVVIRSKVPQLAARLAYMRNFLVFDDVEQGETGYIISTLEAVIFHISHDSDNLTGLSKTNGELWRAVVHGDMGTVRGILKLDHGSLEESEEEEGDEEIEMGDFQESPSKETDMADNDSPPEEETRGRVTYAAGTSSQGRSRSSASIASSLHSLMSLRRTMSSQGIDVNSPDTLAQVRNPAGESLLMMAVQGGQPQVLAYLLDSDLFSTDFVLEDENDEGTTLLSAAMQAGESKVAEVLLRKILQLDEETIRAYFAKPDNSGRTVAHYLFHAPEFIGTLARWLPWRQKDKNGQTPLFALCRSYDHSQYKAMVERALMAARSAQGDSAPLHLDQHVDAKGNTLLHIASDPDVLRTLIRSDADVNATNERGFTALMVASKYGRTEAVKVLFDDPRVDLQIRESRGLTAVELAKDDEVRNAIDGEYAVESVFNRDSDLSDLVLFENPPSPSGYIVGVVRSFFVEDATTRFIVKTGSPRTDQPTITVRTKRRSLADFQFVSKQLHAEHPGSWIPPIPSYQSPYQLPSKPSRGVLRDIQLHLDFFLRALLSHPTFSTHELVWEFFVLPDIETPATEARSAAKIRARKESLDEMALATEPLPMTHSTPFLAHAQEMLQPIARAYVSVARRVQTAAYAYEDMSGAISIMAGTFSALPQSVGFPKEHIESIALHAKALMVHPSHPYTLLAAQTRLFSASLQTLLSTLTLPAELLPPKKDFKSDRNPFSSKPKTPTETPFQKARRETEIQRYVETAADEVAAGEEWRVRWVRERVRALARGMVVRERMVLEGLKRAGREIGVVVDDKPSKKLGKGKAPVRLMEDDEEE